MMSILCLRYLCSARVVMFALGFCAIASCATTKAASQDSGGLRVVVGTAPMSGSADLQCSIGQSESGAFKLSVALRAVCTTQPGVQIELTPQGGKTFYRNPSWVIPQSTGKPAEFALEPLPVLASGTRMNVKVRAKCRDDKIIWGSARCVVGE